MWVVVNRWAKTMQEVLEGPVEGGQGGSARRARISSPALAHQFDVNPLSGNRSDFCATNMAGDPLLKEIL